MPAKWLGQYLAETWQRLTADRFSYVIVADTMLEVDRELGDGRFSEAIDSSFRWREIRRGRDRAAPAEADAGQPSAFRAHGLAGACSWLPRMSYRERWALARER